MKNWTVPSVEELNINETAHNLFGSHHDGGYVGDGIISGHLTWEKPVDPGESDRLPDENAHS